MFVMISLSLTKDRKSWSDPHLPQSQRGDEYVTMESYKHPLPLKSYNFGGLLRLLIYLLLENAAILFPVAGREGEGRPMKQSGRNRTRSSFKTPPCRHAAMSNSLPSPTAMRKYAKR